ncbi:MAG TPA: MBL fold metallo-hydrolase [Nitrospiria bacterium]
MSLEDGFSDIMGKARQGLGYSRRELSGLSGLSEETIRALESGDRAPGDEEVRLIGEALNLRRSCLGPIARETWFPRPLPDWIAAGDPVLTVMGDIGGYAVKGYILMDSGQNEALLFDTACHPEEVLAVLRKRGMTLSGICLTHGHFDHAGGLDRIHREWPVPVYLSGEDEGLLPWKPAEKFLVSPVDGEELRLGRYSVRFISTPGHTPGGTCYAATAEEGALCFVGDTVFAGSIGRSNPATLYTDHLRSLKEIILSLPPETVLLPGHGPGTTIGEERENNPFA